MVWGRQGMVWDFHSSAPGARKQKAVRRLGILVPSTLFPPNFMETPTLQLRGRGAGSLPSFTEHRTKSLKAPASPATHDTHCTIDHFTNSGTTGNAAYQPQTLTKSKYTLGFVLEHPWAAVRPYVWYGGLALRGWQSQGVDLEAGRSHRRRASGEGLPGVCVSHADRVADVFAWDMLIT